MKRFSLLLIIALLLSFAVTCSAAKMPGKTVVKDGNTYVETFVVSTLDQEGIDFWNEWKGSSRNILLTSDSEVSPSYHFIILPDDAGFSIYSRYGKCYASSTKPFQCLTFQRSETDMTRIECTGFFSGTSSLSSVIFDRIVMGTYFDSTSFVFPDLGMDYLVNDYEGQLILADDLGDDPADSGLLGWLKNLWDWLQNFWSKLVEILKSLFVPPSGYFEDWITAVKEKFSEKTGGLSQFMNTLQGKFDALKNGEHAASRLVISLPDDLLYPGFRGVSTDILAEIGPMLSWLRSVANSILVIFTIIHCYRKLICMIKN